MAFYLRDPARQGPEGSPMESRVSRRRGTPFGFHPWGASAGHDFKGDGESTRGDDLLDVGPDAQDLDVPVLSSLGEGVGGSEKSLWGEDQAASLAPHLELVYLVTALVPSDTACLASSPGSSRRTAVWISRDVMVERLL
ncbi:hypothetical protein QTO34_010968 [Cnephaeus nilssonii]|uniref:Uncharacterized protein n=1 Tax=Cnephaeus nilssonii TaxID=3371016 RepID=A0AA40LE95_CNENI|nr:hypothetical protein QTO34_010968 [Eptesicus nilssonii]